VIEIGIKNWNTRGAVPATVSTPVVPGPVSLKNLAATGAAESVSEYDARGFHVAGVFVCGASGAVNYGR
jgi:hypothetical protein